MLIGKHRKKTGNTTPLFPLEPSGTAPERSMVPCHAIRENGVDKYPDSRHSYYNQVLSERNIHELCMAEEWSPHSFLWNP